MASDCEDLERGQSGVLKLLHFLEGGPIGGHNWKRGSDTSHRRLTETYNDISTFLIFSDLSVIFVLADELPLSAPQPTFEHGGFTFSNCSLLHKLLITGQGEQVVSRRGELNRDLLSSTCEFKFLSGMTTKVRCKIGLIKFVTHTGTK